MGQQCTERGEIYEFKPPATATIIDHQPTKILQPEPPKSEDDPFRHLSPGINDRLSQLKYCPQELQQICSHQITHLSNGLIYQGVLENNQMHGMGRLIMPDGSYYQGSFSSNQINGEGILVNSQGLYYLGHFKNNKAEGSGKYVGADFTYQGEFKQNMQSGFGRLTKDNEIYEGTFDRGRKKKGKLTKIREGTVYEGAFQGDIQNGFGRLTMKNETFEGIFQNGLIEGEAKLILANGDTKTVYFKNGKKAERAKNEGIEAYKSIAQLGHSRLIKTN